MEHRDNYALQVRAAQAYFQNYDQEALIRKFSLAHDETYLYFTMAARPEQAIPLYESVIAQCREKGFHVQTGVFGADMQVRSQNDGPVTILLDTKEL